MRPRPSAVRSLPDGDVLTARILEALQKRSPQSPAELTAAAKADRVLVRKRVKALVKSGSVTVTGATMNRQVRLGKPKAPKEGL